MITRAIVLDANILIRAVLGVKVSALIADYAVSVNLLAPDTAFREVQEHLPAILSARGAAAENLAAALRALDALASAYRSGRQPRWVSICRVRSLNRIGLPIDWWRAHIAPDRYVSSIAPVRGTRVRARVA